MSFVVWWLTMNCVWTFQIKLGECPGNFLLTLLKLFSTITVHEHTLGMTAKKSSFVHHRVEDPQCNSGSTFEK